MATINETLVAYIITLLKTISIANGYSFNLDTARVFDSREITLDRGWAVSVYDVADENEDNGYNQHEMSVEIVLTGTSGENTQAHLRERTQDILSAVSAIENHADVDGATYDGYQKTIDHGDVMIGESTINITVSYKTGRWKI